MLKECDVTIIRMSDMKQQNEIGLATIIRNAKKSYEHFLLIFLSSLKKKLRPKLFHRDQNATKFQKVFAA